MHSVPIPEQVNDDSNDDSYDDSSDRPTYSIHHGARGSWNVMYQNRVWNVKDKKTRRMCGVCIKLQNDNNNLTTMYDPYNSRN